MCVNVNKTKPVVDRSTGRRGLYYRQREDGDNLYTKIICGKLIDALYQKEHDSKRTYAFYTRGVEHRVSGLDTHVGLA